MAKNRDIINYVGIGGITLVSALLITAGLTKLIGFPVPIIGEELEVNRKFSTEERIMGQWENVRIYEVKSTSLDNIKTEQEDNTDIIDSDSDNINAIDSIANTLKFLDKNTLTEALNNRNDLNALIIDNVVSREPSGIKTEQGDDIILLDLIDGIVMANIDINGNTGTIAFIKNPKQIDFSIVSDLSYWEYINEHKEREGGLLAVNANTYTWNTTGKYATLSGLAIRHGDMIRKNTTSNVIGFDKDGKLHVGNGVDINELYNATECEPILIKDGQVVYEEESEIKSARTAIGQLEDGTAMFIIVNGGETNSDNGVTHKEVLEVFKKYNATNAAALSSGSKSVMYWDDEVVNVPASENELGVKLPTAFIVKSNSSLPENEQFKIEMNKTNDKIENQSKVEDTSTKTDVEDEVE